MNSENILQHFMFWKIPLFLSCEIFSHYCNIVLICLSGPVGAVGGTLFMLNIVVGEGETHQYAPGITAGEVIRNVHGRKSGAVAALVDGIERDMSQELEDGQTIEPILGESEAGLYILRHSCAHLLAQAVLESTPMPNPLLAHPSRTVSTTTSTWIRFQTKISERLRSE